MNDRSVFLTDLNSLPTISGNFTCYGCAEKDQLEFLINEILEGRSKDETIVIFSENVDRLIQLFESLFVIIKAAGGLVLNEKKEMLFIRRLDKWDLPKGKLEEGEEIPGCAVREVEEECGITNVRLNNEAGITKHTYILKGVPILKYTYWFHMEYGKDEEVVPQTEEGITEVKWIAKTDFDMVRADTSPSIKDLLV